ncbi:MAG: arcB 2 [Gammaproteobacteria bacterium]|nr:arcB 2 [Gammaproteobacteria bacterium]
MMNTKNVMILQGRKNPAKLSYEAIALEAHRLIFDALFKKLPINFYWMDKEGYLLGCNDAVLATFGLNSITEFIGKHSSELVEEDSWLNSKQVMETGETLSIEEVQLRPDGKHITYLTIKSPISDGQGHITGLIGVSLNITERKLLEKELEKAKLDAEQANIAKTEFLMNMSHDIRTPLNGIMGSSQLLQSMDTQPQRRELIDAIMVSARKLSKLLTEIIDLSSLEQGDIPLKLASFNLSSLIADIKEFTLVDLLAKNLKLKISFTELVPEFIVTDKMRLQRILLNLIGNAVKFTESGSIDLGIALEDKHTLKLVVRDTGIGIPEHKFNFIFENFTRISLSDRSKYSGAGLGLYIVKKFINDIGGSIKVESKLNEGSSFTCYVPFC